MVLLSHTFGFGESILVLFMPFVGQFVQHGRVCSCHRFDSRRSISQVRGA